MKFFLEHHLNDAHCFLCGSVLTKENRTDEHIFPKWLQERHKLWNQRIVLLNQTQIPYRQLKIPCCSVCNGGPLSALENDIKAILTGGFLPPTADQEHRLFQWCSKILYGLLRRELTLLADRRNASVGTIVTKEFLNNLTTFHSFMTSIRRSFRFENFTPYSIFVAEALTSPESTRNFNYFDQVASMGDGFHAPLTLSLQSGHYAIFCIFQDNGLQKKVFQDEFDRLEGVPLHPIQFIELACKSAYKHSKLTFSPKYLYSAVGDDSEIVVSPVNEPVGNPWGPWLNVEYAHLFCSAAARNGFDVLEPEDFFVGDRCSTYLFDDTGNPQRFPGF